MATRSVDVAPGRHDPAMDARTLDRLMRELAVAQHGVVSRDQLRRVGAHRQAAAGRLRSGEWAPVTTRVMRLVGVAESREQRAMAAVLDAGEGSVLSHQSAAALWGLPGFDLHEVEISRPRTGPNRGTTLARVHHPRLLPPHHCSVRRQVPVTTLVRTVFDLAGSEHPARAENALHSALRAGLGWDTVRDHLKQVAQKGRPGIELMRELVERHGGKPALGSGLEARFLRVLRRAGLPQPRRQVDLGGEGWAGRVDFVFDDVSLVIEVNGDWHHSGVVDVRRDQERAARLAAAGFRVLPLHEQLVRKDPDEVARLVRAARRLPA